MMDVNIAIVEENQLRSNKLIDTLLHYRGIKIKYAVRSITQIILLIEDTPYPLPDIIFIGTENADIDFEIELKKLKLMCSKTNIIHYSLSESGKILQLNNLEESIANSQIFSPFQLLTEIAFLKTRHPSTAFYKSNLFDQEVIGRIENLSKGELEVVSLIADGFTYAETAKRIGKSINTVRGRIKSIYTKLGIDNGVQLSNLYRLYTGEYQLKPLMHHYHESI
jgi:DNA-binding CsgD family transcriptional regulator